MIDVRGGFVFGEFTYPAGGIYGPLRGSYATLLLLHSGAATISFDGRTLDIDAGDGALVINRDSLTITYRKHLAAQVSWCEARPTKLVQGAGQAGNPFTSRLPISDRMRQILRLGVDLGLESESARNDLRNALGLSLFGAYLFESRDKESEAGIPASLLRVRQHISRHFAEDITLTDLANVAALSPTHLVAVYGKHFGQPPMRDLWATRAEQARGYLQSTPLSCSEIAFRCGYKSQFHFSRHIKQTFGLSPVQLRRNRGYRPPSNELEEVSDLLF